MPFFPFFRPLLLGILLAEIVVLYPSKKKKLVFGLKKKRPRLKPKSVLFSTRSPEPDPSQGHILVKNLGPTNPWAYRQILFSIDALTFQSTDTLFSNFALLHVVEPDLHAALADPLDHIFQTQGLRAESRTPGLVMWPSHPVLQSDHSITLFCLPQLSPSTPYCPLHSLLSIVNTEAYCVFKGMLCFQRLPDVTELSWRRMLSWMWEWEWSPCKSAPPTQRGKTELNTERDVCTGQY